jgi:hypothetical protein
VYLFSFYEIVVKDGIQIYVISSLISSKMKKIVFVFVAFLGICEGTAQRVSGNAGKDSVTQITNPSVRFYPNPATNRVEAEINGFEPGYLIVRVTDDKGRLAREEKRMVIDGNEMIVFMFSLKPGIYFLSFKQGRRQASAKLLIR